MKKKREKGEKNNFRSDKNISTRDEAAAGRKLKIVPSLLHRAIAFNSCSDSKHRDCR